MNILQATHYQVQEEKCLKLLLKEFQGKRILDVGCGHGKYLKLLKSIDCDAIGVDINAKQVAHLNEQGFIAYTPENLPQGQSYDLIFMAHIIEHLNPKELLEMFDYYLSLLSQDGKLIIVTPTLGARFYYDPTHIRPYYPQSLWMMLGDLDTPVAYRSKFCMSLENIYFFKDSWRLREIRSFYPTPYYKGQKICTWLCQISNKFLAYLHFFSKGKLGITASWLGVYGRKKDRV